MFRHIVTITALATGVAGAHAQATVKPDGQMRSAIGIGASLSSGNTKASNLSVVGEAVRATADDKVTLYGNVQYAKSAGATTADQLRLGGRYDLNLGPVWFGFGGLDFERNKFANLKLRSLLTGGFGYHVLKTPTTTWDLFGGLGLATDKFVAATLIDGATRTSYSYVSLLLAEESTHKLSDTTSAKQRLAIFPNLSNSGEFRATFDAGLAVAMSRALSLNVGYSLVHNSEPGLGRKATDSLLTTGVSVKFD
jgi:putative salt-induced outer membrane protein YdiY